MCLEAVVVEAERHQAGDEREHRDPEGVVPGSERGRAEHEQRDRARRQTEGKAERGHVLEVHALREVAAEHRPERPERGGGERVERRLQAVRARMERIGHADQPRADERRHQVEREERTRPLAEHDAGGDHRDHRLQLLEHDRRHRVAVDERLREEDRRDGRRACADHRRREDVARPEPEERRQRGEEQGERDRDQHQVLAEDDRRDFRRLRERPPDPRVEAPQRGGDRDQRDPERPLHAPQRSHARACRRASYAGSSPMSGGNSVGSGRAPSLATASRRTSEPR